MLNSTPPQNDKQKKNIRKGLIVIKTSIGYLAGNNIEYVKI